MWWWGEGVVTCGCQCEAPAPCCTAPCTMGGSTNLLFKCG